MGVRASYLAAAVSLAFAANANAGLVGSTYDFSTAVTVNTQIIANPGTYTDPGNPGFFCVGPPLCDPNGMSVSFSFQDLSPTLATITFQFFGSSRVVNSPTPSNGTFVINLGNFTTPDGSTITGITYASGGLLAGNFSGAWNGSTSTATFIGTSSGDFNNNYSGLGRTVVFNVALASAAVPEPSSLALLGIALVGLGVTRHRRSRV